MIASFGIYELGQVGPLGKVIASYAAAIALLAGGVFLERRERYRILGHTLIGGGWALLFFTTYALHHVNAMRVMGSETADLALMLVVAAGQALRGGRRFPRPLISQKSVYGQSPDGRLSGTYRKGIRPFVDSRRTRNC